MKVEDRIYILRYFLMLFNGFFLILGVTLMGSGLWIFFDNNSFITLIRDKGQNIDPVEFIATCLVLTGLIIVIVCILACVGAYKEIRCLLILYMSCLVIIFTGQLLVTIVILSNTNRINDALVKKVDDIIKTYGNESLEDTGNYKHEWKLMDAVQHNLKCCGKDNYTNWQQNDKIASEKDDNIFPCSCMNVTISEMFCNHTHLNEYQVFNQGCEQLMKDWLSRNVLAVLGLDLGLAIIQVFQFVLAVYLFRNIGRRRL
ncbi:tetraspanin-19 [Amia ocellicauda]|uniref:tetraspanin-19 n=1 Tax=Amia ocellicauda TaxID=2972642 RepID=UPI003463C0B2